MCGRNRNSPDASNVAEVGSDDESDGDDVVGEHLPVIFTSSFDVERHQLVEPECESVGTNETKKRSACVGLMG